MGMGRAIYLFFMMKKIKIVKPHQNAGVWFHAGQIVDAPDTRAKDLIEAGLATSDLSEPEKTKERIGKQTKPDKATLTKSVKANTGEIDGNDSHQEDGNQFDKNSRDE